MLYRCLLLHLLRPPPPPIYPPLHSMLSDDESTGDEHCSSSSCSEDYLDSPPVAAAGASSSALPLGFTRELASLNLGYDFDFGLPEDDGDADWIDEDSGLRTSANPGSPEHSTSPRLDACPLRDVSPSGSARRSYKPRPAPWRTADETFRPHSTPTRPNVSSYHRRTQNFESFVRKQGDLDERVLKVLDYMTELQLDLPLLLDAICWGSSSLTSNPTVRFARTALMVSKQLPQIIKRMHRPPRKDRTGSRTRAGTTALNEWALATVKRLVNKEMRKLDPVFRETEQVSEERLLAVKWKDVIAQTQTVAPCLWSLLRCTSVTPSQERRNTMKTPESVSISVHVEFASRSLGSNSSS